MSSWVNLFVRGAARHKGAEPPILHCAANVDLILTHDQRLRGVFAFDEFAGDVVAARPIDWPKSLKPGADKPNVWTDADTITLGVHIAREYNFAPSTATVAEGMLSVARRKTIHPVRDWLKSLKWDRRKRLDNWLVRLAGAEDTSYVRAVGKSFLIGAVARVMKPGSQVDSMPVFEGKQGGGKTSMLRILGGKWFLETNIDIGSKDGYQALRDAWIVEFGELDSLTRAEISRVKQFVTTCIDKYRPSYGRATIAFPRQCVFAGTTNPMDYLKDDTGSRRFWPVLVGRVLLKELAEERDQLWAEAAYRYAKGEQWHLTDPEVLAAAAEAAEDRRQAHPWEPIVALELDQRVREFTRTGKNPAVSTGDVLDWLDIEARLRTRSDEMQAATILRRFGWEKHARERRTWGREYMWKPAEHVIAETKRRLAEADEKQRQRLVANLGRKNSEKIEKKRSNPNLDRDAEGVTTRTGVRLRMVDSASQSHSRLGQADGTSGKRPRSGPTPQKHRRRKDVE